MSNKIHPPKLLSIVFVVLSLTLLLCVPLSAHPGNTDSAGGHYDHSNGTYHYHHGYPAHQHENGVCPYRSSSNNSSSDNSVGTVIAVAIGGVIVIGVIAAIINHRKTPKT